MSSEQAMNATFRILYCISVRDSERENHDEIKFVPKKTNLKRFHNEK